jgi:hypothetical protein
MSDNRKSIWADKDIDELVFLLANQGDPASRAHQEVKGALAAALTRHLSESIDRHERAATKLSNQLLWLNITLGVFTVVGTVLTIVSLIKQPP